MSLFMLICSPDTRAGRQHR